MPDTPLTGQVVAVTGASCGIGEAVALAAAEEGAAVALAARRQDRVEKLARRIGSAGGRAVAVAIDVADEGRLAPSPRARPSGSGGSTRSSTTRA